ncbi:MAG: hypothetical protein ACI901_000342 [Octadecabacter sp.]|jgi:hypothetical protein
MWNYVEVPQNSLTLCFVVLNSMSNEYDQSNTIYPQTYRLAVMQAVKPRYVVEGLDIVAFYAWRFQFTKLPSVSVKISKPAAEIIHLKRELARATRSTIPEKATA